jgi:hypothetical protein
MAAIDAYISIDFFLENVKSVFELEALQKLLYKIHAV